MCNRDKEIAVRFWAALFLIIVLAAIVPLRAVTAAGESSTATESIIIQGSVGAHSPIQNTINKQDPAVLAAMTKTFADQMAATTEARVKAEAKAAELAQKLGFTSTAVAEFFKILGEQNVPDEKIPARLIEIATHFAQTRDELAALEPDDPHAAELTRSAKAALDAGRLTEADGLLDQAKEAELAAFRQAHELKEKAQDAEDRHALNAAKLHAGRGDIALTQLRYADAAQHYEAAAALLPSSASGTKAVYLVQAGDMRQTSGNLAAALTSYQASHAIFERLAKADPGNAGWQRDLSVSHNKIGDVQQAQGDLAAALTSYQASLAIAERLAKADPGNAGWQRDLSVSHDKIGDVQQAQGDLAAALTSYQASLAIRERLAKADPGNAGWQRDLSVSHDKIGDVQQAQGDLAAALTSYQASLAIAERLAKADPGNAGWQRDLSVSHNKIGDVQQAQGDLAAALTSYQASLAICRASGESGPGQRRLAARPLGVAQQDRRRAAGAGRPGGGADQLPGLARDRRASGESRPRQRRLAARPLGVAQQDRRRAAGAGRPGGGADELPGLARD